MTRAEKVVEAQRLRAQGLKLREIGELMGAPLKTVHSWISDPDLAKHRARKASYASPCVDCGGPTDGSGGRAVPRTRCAWCAAHYRHESRFWTPEQVIEALQVWAERLGRPPTADEAQREGAYVAQSTVVQEFGSWNAGIEAAGFVPCPVGSYRRVSSRKYGRRSAGLAT